jgi:hypothetical protein
MKETLKHNEAFEHYYRMGAARSLRGLAREIGVSRASVDRWNKEFGWAEQVQMRDVKVAKELEKDTISDVVKEKAEMLKTVNAYMGIVRRQLQTILKKLKDNQPIQGLTDSVHLSEIKTAVEIYKDLQKMKLELLGEQTESLKLEIPTDFSQLALYMADMEKAKKAKK